MRSCAGTAVYTIVAAVLLVGAMLATDGGTIAHAQVGLPPVTGPLTRPIEREFDRVDRSASRIKRRAEDADEQLEQPVENGTEDPDLSADGADAVSEAVQDAGAAVNTAASIASQAARGATGALRAFVPAVDASGWPIEENVVLMLLDKRQLAAIAQSGIEVLTRRNLPALGRTLVSVRDAGRLAPRILQDLRQAHPDVVSDLNHIYRFASEPQHSAASDDAPRLKAAATAGEALRVGMIDSAVNADHFSLQDSLVVTRDFVAHDGDRPLGHGTAVASLIARSAANEAEIHAASVFFQASGYAPGASTESLVAALDWLASQQVDAINMSLAGPANVLLEEALRAFPENGPAVIAAVGNNGPSGEPLYPAAYEGIIGVTAVDRKRKIFRYANRGDHVDYAALGVDVKVADSGGSWRLESGTSMASPHVAVVVARMRRYDAMPLTALMNALTNSAEDLGKKDFDPVFGHGLITDLPPLVSQRSQPPLEHQGGRTQPN